MKNFPIMHFFCMFLFFSFTAFADGFFIAGFEDIPLAPNLENNAEELSFFDTPQGRIIESQTTISAGGSRAVKRVFAFYRRSLPALGWRETVFEKNRAVFIREGESLTIERMGKYIRFLLSPPKAG